MGSLPGVGCGLPVFLHHGSDSMVNVGQLLEYAACAFATKRLRYATIESPLSTTKFFHRTLRGFELDTTHRPCECPQRGRSFARRGGYRNGRASACLVSHAASESDVVSRVVKRGLRFVTRSAFLVLSVDQGV